MTVPTEAYVCESEADYKSGPPCTRCWGSGKANAGGWRDVGEPQDMRTWFRREPLFVTHFDMVTVLPHELDLLEVGPRVAVSYLEEAMRERSSYWVWKYRA